MYRRNKMLKEVAEKRLAAIKEYSDLGSGFKIAMRDLEIRGAGNLLGAEQSGHMEAVGYDLYCKMLSEAVKEAKGIEDISDKFDTTVDIVTDAYIPAGYIANEFQKLDIYKRIAGIETEEEKDEMLEELIDRFGEPPKSVLSLLRVARLKALAHAVYITEIKQTGSLIKLTMFERARINPEKIPMLVAQYKSSLKFNMAENPYFTFDLKNGSVAKKRDVLDVVEELISQMRKELITAE
jgi:TRCF domain